MSERDAFLAKIAAEPDCDAHRLVFADWLDEHGEDRQAAFIRRQIENARSDAGRTFLPIPVRPTAFRTTFGEIANCKPWERLKHLDKIVSPMLLIVGGRRNYVQCVGWHRGFPAVVGCTERKWHEHHLLFPGPVESLCLRNRGGCWGSYTDDDGGVWYKSMVSRTVPKVKADLSGAFWSPVLAAFPNVRLECGPCTAGLLREFCIVSRYRAALPAEALV